MVAWASAEKLLNIVDSDSIDWGFGVLGFW